MNSCKFPECLGVKSWQDAFGRYHRRDCDHIAIATAVNDSKFSHVTSRELFGRDVLFVYHKESGSPTGVLLHSSYEENPENIKVLSDNGKRSVPGPSRGNMARL